MRKGIAILAVILIALVLLSFTGAYLITKQRQGIGFGDKVAIVEIHGTISASQTSGAFEVEKATPQTFKKLLKKAEKDSSVKAIVIDINSPGGSVVASEEMAEAIKACEKPTIAWLNEIATSGAYYVASACDYIIADRATITGSIGVISILPEYSELLKKIGINMQVIKSGEHKDFSSGFRPMTEEEEEMMQDVINEIYDQFVGEVAEGRNLSIDYVKTVSEGQIYSSRRALELKLIDEVGSKERAIKMAAHMGEIEGEPVVVTYRKISFFEEFVGVTFSHFGYGFAKGLTENLKTNLVY